MSVNLLVGRAPEDKQGANIVVAYLSSDQAARERVRVEIDKSFPGCRIVSGTVPGLRSWIKPNSIVTIIYMDEGACKARVLSCSRTIQRDKNGKMTATMNVRLRRVKK